MALHLLKLCVGVETIVELETGIAERRHQRGVANEPVEQIHTTRMVPKRAAEVCDGGSLVWVIRGQVAARQLIRDIRPLVGDDGIARCQLVLEPAVVRVEPRPCRRFQGWRYLADELRPRDLDPGGGELPESLRYALRELCLL